MIPYTLDELVRLGQSLPFTHVARVGIRTGTPLDTAKAAGLRCGLTRQGVEAALKRAGYRMPKLTPAAPPPPPAGGG